MLHFFKSSLPFVNIAFPLDFYTPNENLIVLVCKIYCRFVNKNTCILCCKIIKCFVCVDKRKSQRIQKRKFSAFDEFASFGTRTSRIVVQMSMQLSSIKFLREVVCFNMLHYLPLISRK